MKKVKCHTCGEFMKMDKLLVNRPFDGRLIKKNKGEKVPTINKFTCPNCKTKAQVFMGCI